MTAHPTADAASSAAPADAASALRRVVTASPVTPASTSAHSGSVLPMPAITSPSVASPPAASRYHPSPDPPHLPGGSQAPPDIGGHRLDRGPAQVAGIVGRTQADETGASTAAPPRGPGAVEPRHRHHAACSGWALGRGGHEVGHALTGEVGQPGHQRAGGGQAALDQPPARSRAGEDELVPTRGWSVDHRDDHAGRRPPAHQTGSPARRRRRAPRRPGRRLRSLRPHPPAVPGLPPPRPPADPQRCRGREREGGARPPGPPVRRRDRRPDRRGRPGRRDRCARPSWCRWSRGRSSRATTRSRGESSHRAASRRPGSCSTSQATLAATEPPSRGTPVRARTAAAPPSDRARAAASTPARRSDQSRPGPNGAPSASTGTKVWRAPQQDTAWREPRERPAAVAAARVASTTEVHHDPGSCSARPTSGRTVTNGARPNATSPSESHNAALVTVVPRSMVRITGRGRRRPTSPPSRLGRDAG